MQCISVYEFAHLIGITRQRLYAMWDDGKGPPLRGRRRHHSACVDLAEGERWAEARAKALPDEADRARYADIARRIHVERRMGDGLAQLRQSQAHITELQAKYPSKRQSNGTGTRVATPGKSIDVMDRRRARATGEEPATEWLPAFPIIAKA
jgi:hypothetical protein